MNVQIFGFKNCQDTRKAQRFFAERRIAVHFVDLDERPAAKGELRRFAERFGRRRADRQGGRALQGPRPPRGRRLAASACSTAR